MSSYSTRIPACASPSLSAAPFSGSSLRKSQGDDEETEDGDVDADEECSDEEGDNAPWSATSRGRGKSLRKHVNPMKGKGKSKDRVEEGSKDEVFFGIRCR